MVYILGRGSKWQNNELRYSLRSLKYFSHGKVFVVGERPEWLRNVIHIDAVDGFSSPDHSYKLKNATHKIRIACFHPEVSERFMLMNDDFFFLRPIKEIPNFVLGNLNKGIANHITQDGYYFKALCDTRDMLQSAGFVNPLNYEVHFPIVFEKRKFLKLTNSISWHAAGYLFRSLYGNIYNIGSVKRDDPKIYHLCELKKFREGDLLSTNDYVVATPQFQKWVSEKFPVPSIYEDPETTPEALSS